MAERPRRARLGIALLFGLFGFARGGWTARVAAVIAVNANAARFQRAYGRPVLSPFHSVYPIGGLLGAVVALRITGPVEGRYPVTLERMGT